MPFPPFSLRGARAVVFDLDDTLVNWREAEHHAMGDLSRLHFVAAGVGEAEVRRAYAAVMEENFRAFRATGQWWYIADRLAILSQRLGVAAQCPTDALAADFKLHVGRHLALLPGALAALAAARGSGAKVALLTNGPSVVQRPKVEALGLQPHFDFIGITGEMGHWKPDAQAFRHVLDRLGAVPGESVMVGDSIDFDVVPAKALGMRTVWVNPGGGDHPAADVVVATPSHLPAHFA